MVFGILVAGIVGGSISYALSQTNNDNILISVKHYLMKQEYIYNIVMEKSILKFYVLNMDNITFTLFVEDNRLNLHLVGDDINKTYKFDNIEKLIKVLDDINNI